jgi:hypothetical protein
MCLAGGYVASIASLDVDADANAATTTSRIYDVLVFAIEMTN